MLYKGCHLRGVVILEIGRPCILQSCRLRLTGVGKEMLEASLECAFCTPHWEGNQGLKNPLHDEIWQYCQSTSRLQA